MKKILITGANGQLGSEIREISYLISDAEFFFTDVEDLDITNFSEIEKFVSKYSINWIVNCAAYTAVDNAEKDTYKANLLNGTAVGYLAKAAKETNATFIHVSTDYVFDGKSYIPYKEDMIPCPNSAYGRSKEFGEKEALKENINSIIIRTSWLYSAFGNNFVKTMIRLGDERDTLGVLFDQIGTPTYAHDLAKAILEIIKSEKNLEEIKGIYHFSNEGVCSWYDFAIEIHKEARVSCKIKPIETHQYPLPANRPPYSVLNKSKIKSIFGIEIPFWRDSLIHCIKRLKK